MPDLQVLGKCGAAASQVTVRQAMHELPYEDQITKQTKPNQTYLPTCSLQTLPTTYNTAAHVWPALSLPLGTLYTYSALLE